MKRGGAVAGLLIAVLLVGCGGMKPTEFLHPEFDFAYVERVAVIPFDNLSDDQGAAARATRYFISELLATESFDVVEPGEVARVLAGFALVRTADLTENQILAIGDSLAVQGLFLGSVGESSTIRSGGRATSVVTLDTRLLETDRGVTVWSATHTESSRSFWASLFGTGEKSRSEVTRKCVEKIIGTLVN